MALPGKNARVKIGADVIKGLNDASFSANGETIETTNFESDGWKEKIQGLKDFGLSLSGFYEPTDTNGQVALRTAYLNGTTVTVDYLVDGTVGFQGAYLVTSMEIGAGAGGEVSVSYELESTGALTIV